MIALRAVAVAALAGLLMTAVSSAHASSHTSTDTSTNTSTDTSIVDIDTILVSSDGVSYATELAAPLFSGIPVLVPSDEVSRTFWVRNPTDRDVYLRVDLRDVVVSDAGYAEALTIRADVDGVRGTPVTLAMVRGCRVVTAGVPVGPGESVTVSPVLALTDVTGKQAQVARASLNFGIAMSDAQAADSDAATCGPTDQVLPGIDPLPGTDEEPGSSNTPVPDTDVDDTTPTPTPEDGSAPSPSATPVSTNTADPYAGTNVDPPDDGASGSVWSNTGRFFDEYLVVLLFGAFVIGAAWFILASRRRDRRDAEAVEGES